MPPRTENPLDQRSKGEQCPALVFLVDRLRHACVEIIGHDRDIVHYLIAIAIERSEAGRKR